MNSARGGRADGLDDADVCRCAIELAARYNNGARMSAASADATARLASRLRGRDAEAHAQRVRERALADWLRRASVRPGASGARGVKRLLAQCLSAAVLTVLVAVRSDEQALRAALDALFDASASAWTERSWRGALLDAAVVAVRDAAHSDNEAAAQR